MRNSIYIIILIIIGAGCNINELEFDNLDAPTLDGDVAVPLGRLQYTMRELIDEINDNELELVEDDSTSLLMMIYRDTAEFAAPNELIQISDIVNSTSIPMRDMTGDDASPVFIYDDWVDFSYSADEGERIDSIFYKSGQLLLDVTKTFPYDIYYTVTVRNTVHESTRARAQFDDSNRSSTPIDLSDYMTALTQENDTNTFVVDLFFSVSLGPGEQLTSEDEVTFSLRYVDQTFDAIYGQFGQDTVTVGDEVLDVAFFKDMGDSGLEFGDPQINFSFSNSFGLPVGLSFGGLYGASGDSISGDTTYLSGKVTNSLQLVEAATPTTGTNISEFSINNDNSNLQSLLEASPEKIGFGLMAVANPHDALTSNFIYDTSRISTVIEMIMPMVLSMNNVTQEIKFDNKGGLKFDESDSMYIRIISENELPFSSAIELEIRDENDTLLHTIAEKVILKAPLTDTDGMVLEPRKAISDVFVSQEGIEAFNEGKKIILRLTLNTSGQSPGRDFYVKVLADYKVDLQVSAIGRLKYTLK